MDNQKLLKVGITGTVIAIICCFTPALVVLLGALGLSAWLGWLGWLDFVLLPILAVFILMTAYAVWKKYK